MIWIIYALLHSLFRAMFVETGRFFPMDGWVKTFWQAGFGLLLLLPFIPVMAWPDDPMFYAAAALVSLTMTVGTLIQLNLTLLQSGRVTSIYMPLEAAAAFLIWLAINPSQGAAMLAEPLQVVAVVLAFAIAVTALLIVRPNDVGWRAVMLVAPVGVSFAIAGVVTKLTLPASNLIPLTLTYLFVNYAVMTAVMALTMVLKKKMTREVLKTRTLQGGLITGLFSTSSYATFIAGVALAPNPGYTSFMAMLLPVWMIGLHKLFRVREQASPVAAFLLIISAAILFLGVIYTI
jgi:hypothetical protein